MDRLSGPPEPLQMSVVPAASKLYISLVFSNARRVLSQCNTELRRLYLLTIIKHDLTMRKIAFSGTRCEAKLSFHLQFPCHKGAQKGRRT